MATVEFWVYMEGQLFMSPLIDKSRKLAVLLAELQKAQATAPLFSDVNIQTCTLYKFRTPLTIDGDKAELVTACFEARGDWIKIDDIKKISALASDELLSDDYICLAIETPKGQHETIINDLTSSNQPLFKSLQIRLQNIRTWTEADVHENLHGGVWETDTRRDAFTQILEQLSKPRAFYNPQRVEVDQFAEDLSLAKKYKGLFKAYFDEHRVNTRSADGVENSREFVAFYSLLRCHEPDATAVSEDPSSHFKANQLSSYFFMPPFFSCRKVPSKTIFKTELPWGFPIFIATREEERNWCQYTPCSDFSVCAKDFLCPFLICEVISEGNESDRYRMLLQGIAAIRAINLLTKSSSKDEACVVAVYLRANLTAECYIIKQTPGRRTSSRTSQTARTASSVIPQVSILQINYDLKESDEAVAFLKAMFNLQVKMDNLAENLDEKSKKALATIATVADKLTTLTQRRKETQGTRGRTQGGGLDTIPEEPQRHGRRRADQSHFADHPEIQARLAEMGYQVDMKLHGFPNVVMIGRISDPFARGFLKFTREQREVEVSRYLANITSPDNHTIRDLSVWELRSGGFVIYSASGGSHLVALKAPDVHMWSAAKQLVEGVAFMHRHRVAHLDIKPANVLISPGGGRLSIIDFSISEIVEPNGKIRGTIGTDGYMAPEVFVEDVAYDPIRADLWSTGKTLEELTSCCSVSSREKEFVVGIAQQLMAKNPSERPMMSEVVKMMADFESSPVLRPQMRLPSPMVPSETRA